MSASKSIGEDRLMSAKEVCDLLRISDTTLWRGIKRGQIPAPIKLGPRRYWRQATIKAFIEKLEKEAMEAAS